MTTNVHEIYPPLPDLDVALEFLKTINPDGRQMLVGYIDETGAPDTIHRLFEPGQWDQKRSLITLWASERRNIWVLPNEPKAGGGKGDGDIAFIRAVWSDTDNKGVQAAAIDAVDSPFRVSHAAYANDSGGGIHTFWLLDKPVAVDAASKALADLVGRGLQEAFGGDPVWNINRPMRVPGTVNYLNAKKRAAGRQIAPTFVLASGNERVTLEQMALDFPAKGGAATGATVTDEALKRAFAEIDMGRVNGVLPEPLRKKLEATKTYSGLWGSGVVAGDKSESGHLFQLALALRKEGFTGTEFAILAAAWGKIKAAHLEHRPLARAWARASGEAQARRVFDDGATAPEDEPAAAKAGPAKGKIAGVVGLDPAKFPRRQWLYWQRLIRGYLSSTVAAGGTGKSSLTMVEGVAMASGRNLLGIDDEHMPLEPLRVLIWNGEDPQEELMRRFIAIQKHFGVTNAEIGGRLFLLSGHDFPLGFGGASHDEDVKWLKEVIREHKIDVIVVDPFVSSHSVPENDNVQIDRVAKTWSRIAEKCRCAVDLVHHIRKPMNGSTMDLTVDDARGASALINASRNARVLSPMSDTQAREYQVNRKAYFAIQRDATKANMAPGMVGTDWFRFISVDLGNGEVFGAGEDERSIPGDSVGVVERWTPTVPISNDPAKIEAAQDEIDKGEYKLNVQGEPWVGEPIAKALGLDVKGDRKLLKSTITAWIEEGWLVVKAGKDRKGNPRDFVIKGSKPPTPEPF